MLNHITIQGRLTRDPEYKITPGDVAYANFTLAVDRDYAGRDGTKETDFLDCTAWRHEADFVQKYFSKGDSMIVSGRLQINTWKDSSGSSRRSAVIQVENAYFCGTKREKGTTPSPAPAPATAPAVDPLLQQDMFTDLGDVSEDELPF